MKAGYLLLASVVSLLVGCSHARDDEPAQQATAAHIQPVRMSLMATDNCAEAGGTLAYSRQLDGSRIGMCQLVNGKRCNEAALINGNCTR